MKFARILAGICASIALTVFAGVALASCERADFDIMDYWHPYATRGHFI
jgi:hypothetical protein